MTAKEQEAWDEARADKIAERETADVADRENAEYTTMSDDGKAVYDAEYLKWKKLWFATCQENAFTIQCIMGRDIRIDEENAREKVGYYEMDASERQEFDQTLQSELAEREAYLTKAWIKDNVPAPGELGSACSADNKCTGENQCCGTGTPSENADDVTDG